MLSHRFSGGKPGAVCCAIQARKRVKIRQVELMASYPQVPASGQRLAIKVDLQGGSE